VISILDPSRLYRWIRGEVPRVSPALTATAREDGNREAPAVLVVDDSISVRKALARGLQAIGLEVDEVTDGLEALGRLRGRAFDAVVTDLEMPRLAGFGLVAEMQRSAELARIPVIVASTRSDEESKRRALALGASRFLAKPVSPEKLAEAILPLIARARGRGPEVGSEVVR